MNWKLPDNASSEDTPQSIGASWVEPVPLMSLPLDGWPSCFGSARKSAEGECYEVMLNETAWSEAWKIWKFHPPKHSAIVTKLTDELKGLPPFVSDADLTEDIGLLCDYAAKKWIIEDSFIDHVTDRFEFRDSHRDFWQYSKKHSRIGRNSMNPVSGAVFMINQTISMNVPTRLNTLWNRIESEKYDDKTFAEKVAFIEEIDQDIVQYLEAIHSHLSSK